MQKINDLNFDQNTAIIQTNKFNLKSRLLFINMHSLIHNRYTDAWFFRYGEYGQTPGTKRQAIFWKKGRIYLTQGLLMHRVIAKENGSQGEGLKDKKEKEKKRKKTKTFPVCIMTVHEFMGTGKDSCSLRQTPGVLPEERHQLQVSHLTLCFLKFIFFPSH